MAEANGARLLQSYISFAVYLRNGASSSVFCPFDAYRCADRRPTEHLSHFFLTGLSFAVHQLLRHQPALPRPGRRAKGICAVAFQQRVAEGEEQAQIGIEQLPIDVQNGGDLLAGQRVGIDLLID